MLNSRKPPDGTQNIMLNIRPNSAAHFAAFQSALAAHRAGRLAEAEERYRQILSNDNGHADAYHMLGILHHEKGDTSEAEILIRRALAIREDANFLANLGMLLLETNHLPEAEAAYRRTLELNPYSADAHCNLGLLLKKTKRLAEAEAAYRRALAVRPDFVDAHINLGILLKETNRLPEAEASYRRALAVKPDFVHAHYNLGNLLKETNRLAEAEAAYRRALAVRHDFVAAHINLGLLLQETNRLSEAEASYRCALAVKPEFAEVHNNLGNVLRELGQLDDAAASFRRALEIKPDFAEAHNNLGIMLRHQRRTAEAEASCQRALEINPDLADAIAFMADLRADKGQFAEAEALLQRAISLEPKSPEAWAGIARVRKMTSGDAAWLEAAQKIAEHGISPRKEVYLRYSIGKYYDDVGDFEQAFVNYQRANELTKLYGEKYESLHQTLAVDLQCRVYDRDWISRERVNANASVRPVFIVGMPRSGTSLTEQILASHPAVFGAGEVTFWKTASPTPAPSAPKCVITESMLDKLADDYLQLLESFSADACRVVDKMPTNFLFLGLIHVVFPNARIIHMQRNPIDTCLSIYFQNFDTSHSYANDLGDLAHYYREYFRVMEHWRITLPEHAILHVPYEGLVDDQEGWSRKMLEFVGLPWNPSCLDFHQTVRTVSTASKWQVRQKINRLSVERWRNYEKFVEPLLNLTELGPRRCR